MCTPPSCGIMGIVQVAWRSALCPRRSRRRRAVMTCSSARSPSLPSQLIPASRSPRVVVAAVVERDGGAPSLELLVMCLAAVPILPLVPFHCCSHVCFIDAFLALRRDWHLLQKVSPVGVFYPSGIRETHECTFQRWDMEGNISAGYPRSTSLQRWEPAHNKHQSWKCPTRCHIIIPSKQVLTFGAAGDTKVEL